jgi:quercetin dioxygenase-like cupin family protein
MRIPGPDDASHGRPPARTRLMPAGAGETVHVLIDSATVKVGVEDTAGAFSLVEVALSAGGGVPAHVHAGDDETIYVLEGTLDVRVGDDRLTLGAGGCAFAPRGTVHGFTNPDFGPARLLLISSPAIGSGRVFLELAAGFATSQGHGPGGAPPGPGADDLATAFRRIAASGGVALHAGAHDER